MKAYYLLLGLLLSGHAVAADQLWSLVIRDAQGNVKLTGEPKHKQDCLDTAYEIHNYVWSKGDTVSCRSH